MSEAEQNYKEEQSRKRHTKCGAEAQGTGKEAE